MQILSSTTAIEELESEEREREMERKEGALVLFFALCQPWATTMLVNHNILARQRTSLSCVYISRCIP